MFLFCVCMGLAMVNANVETITAYTNIDLFRKTTHNIILYVWCDSVDAGIHNIMHIVSYV